MKKTIKTIPDLIENDRMKGSNALEQLKSKLSKTSFKNRENWVILLHNELNSGIKNELGIIYQQRQVPWKVIIFNFSITIVFAFIYQYLLQNSSPLIRLLFTSATSIVVLFLSIIATILIYRINLNSQYHRIISNTQKELRDRITGIDSVIESHIISNFSEFIIEINQMKNNNVTQKYLAVWQYIMLWTIALFPLFIMSFEYFKNL